MKVLIAKNYGLVSQRIRDSVLELTSVEMVSQVRKLNGIQDAVQQLKPDVVIMDIYIPDNRTLQAVSAIKETLISPSVIVLIACLASQFPHYQKKFLSVGAECVLNMTNGSEQLLECLRDSEKSSIEMKTSAVMT